METAAPPSRPARTALARARASAVDAADGTNGAATRGGVIVCARATVRARWLGAFVCAEKEYSYDMFYMCYICDVCPKVMFSFHARQSNIVIFIVIVISSRVASRDLAFARSIDAAMLFSSRAAALGASAPRARERRLDSRRGRLDRNRRPSRVLARRPASSRAADPSEDDVDPLGARGERVAVVGVGTRGCALADALAEAPRCRTPNIGRSTPTSSRWSDLAREIDGVCLRITSR